MDEDETQPKPVLVPKPKRRKRGEPEQKVTPAAPESQPPTEPDPPKPAASGDPDHGLVPVPPKRLLEPQEFFRFWNSIPKRERDAWFIAYVYRKLPVCDVLQPLSEEELRLITSRKKKAPESNCGKLSEPFNPENWEQEVYQWKGAGDYHIRLNDTHPSVKSTVCETQIRGLRDWDNFPPILNLAEVVLEEPLNQPYLRWARLRGIQFPGDPGAQAPITPFDSEEDMAANVAVEKLTDALIETTRNKPQPVPIMQPTPNADAAAEAVRATTSAFKDTSKALVEMIQEGNKAQAKAQDPLEFHKSVMEAARLAAPPPASGNAEVLSLMQMMMKQQADANALMLAQLEKRLESAERRAEAAETRAQAALHPPAPAVNPAVANPVKDAIELIKSLGNLRDTAAGLVAPEAADADMPVWARVASKVIDAAPSMLHNAAVMFSGQGTPVPPPDLNPEVVEAENQPAAVEAAEEEEVFSKSRIAQEIAAPLIDALNKQHKGFQFAAGMILTPRIMGFPGRVVYEMAIEEGQDGLLAILQSYPPLWQKLIQIPRQLEQFIREFFDSATAYQIARQSQQPAPQTEAPKAATPEVLPPENGRTVIGPDGSRIQTAGRKGPVVNGPAVQEQAAN